MKEIQFIKKEYFMHFDGGVRMYNKFKRLRNYVGLSKSQLASLTYINYNKYMRYENNTIFPSFDDILLMSRMYGVTPDSIIYPQKAIGNPEIFKNEKANDYIGTEKMVQLLSNRLCHECPYACSKIDYNARTGILAKYKKKIGNNLSFLREESHTKTETISRQINKPKEYYKLLELGKLLPSVSEIILITRFYGVSINSLLK